MISDYLYEIFTYDLIVCKRFSVVQVYMYNACYSKMYDFQSAQQTATSVQQPNAPSVTMATDLLLMD